MTPVKQLLDRIIWDKNLNKEEFSLGYLDRVSKKLLWVKVIEISAIDGNMMVLEQGDKSVHIPLHRIREVRR